MAVNVGLRRELCSLRQILMFSYSDKFCPLVQGCFRCTFVFS